MAALMRARAKASAGVVLFVGVALTGASHAQARRQAPVPVPTAEELAAREAFGRGVHALDESRFAEAAAAFEQSYSLNPAPVAQFNLAFAYRGLGRHLDAIATLERFLQSPGNTPADRVQAGRVELESLRATIARLRVTCVPSTAAVLVDGRPATVTDDGAILLDPGRHAVELSRDGFRPQRREIVLAPGANESLSVTLAVIDDAGRLRIEPTVPSARVSIDGVFAGTGIVERPARMGTHRVVITAEGYLSLERTVRVGGTGLVRVDATLQRPRANPWPWLGPTIGVVAVVGLSVGGYFLADSLRPTAPPPSPSDAWGDPIF
jgi:hypothetical protein